jgi:hypothetical protein
MTSINMAMWILWERHLFFFLHELLVAPLTFSFPCSLALGHLLFWWSFIWAEKKITKLIQRRVAQACSPVLSLHTHIHKHTHPRAHALIHAFESKLQTWLFIRNYSGCVS